MLSTIYVQAKNTTTENKIRQIYNTCYDDDFFVRILSKGKYPAISHVRGTNCCDIGFHFDEKTGQIVIVSAIDNLLKGAAGQAIQNMNIMFGLADNTGLDYVQAPL